MKAEASSGRSAQWIPLAAIAIVFFAWIAVALVRNDTPDEVVSEVPIPDPPQQRQKEPATQPKPERLRVEVVARYPHDKTAFTQGLLWHEGLLYESTGQYGQSAVRAHLLDTGRVLRERTLERRFFGEGIAIVDDAIYQLTWRERKALVWEAQTLTPTRSFDYEGEGWGLCFDGKSLVMSDGSATLAFRDPETFKVTRRVTVKRHGINVRFLNELECVDGSVYANVWRRNEIMKIDPSTGEVTAVVDAKGLLKPKEDRDADVLNGIAYVPERKTFLLTGKLWPAVFEVRFEPAL